MSQRERWVIYPLLFLTFSLAIRDQWPLAKSKSGSFHALQCRSLTVNDDNGNPAVFIGTRTEPRHRGSGELRIYAHEPSGVGASKPPAVRLRVSNDYRGVVEAHGQLGMQVAELTGDMAGGRLALFDERGVPIDADRSSPAQTSPAETGAAETGAASGTSAAPPETTPDGADQPRTAPPRPPRPPEEPGADST